MIILQRKIFLFQNFHFFVLIQRIQIFIEIGKLVIVYDRFRPHLFDIICYERIYRFSALKGSLYVAAEVWPRCISIGQINDDFILRIPFKLLFASGVIAYRVNGSLMG